MNQVEDYLGVMLASLWPAVAEACTGGRRGGYAAVASCQL